MKGYITLALTFPTFTSLMSDLHMGKEYCNINIHPLRKYYQNKIVKKIKSNARKKVIKHLFCCKIDLQQKSSTI
jgi:hypothetical protein